MDKISSNSDIVNNEKSIHPVQLESPLNFIVPGEFTIWLVTTILISPSKGVSVQNHYRVNATTRLEAKIKVAKKIKDNMEMFPKAWGQYTPNDIVHEFHLGYYTPPPPRAILILDPISPSQLDDVF